MQDSYSSLDESYILESFIITGHLSPIHYELTYNSSKKFKKIIKNDSDDAFKINVKAHRFKVTGIPVSQKSSELLDEIVDHPEKFQKDLKFMEILKRLELYPSEDFYLWNKHIEIYNTLEKNNFSKTHTIEMYQFLRENFFINEYQLISLNLLMKRDFNIFLILFHLDSLAFNEQFKNISLYKYLLIGKIKGKRKSPSHLFWNLVKVIACMESKKIGISYDFSKNVPKDEDSFSLINGTQAERIKYSVRKLKEGKEGLFYLSHLYHMVGAEKLHQNSIFFNGFSLTGVWLIYIYSIILIRSKSVITKLTISDLDVIFNAFSTKYKSEGTNQWPSDLSNY